MIIEDCLNEFAGTILLQYFVGLLLLFMLLQELLAVGIFLWIIFSCISKDACKFLA